MSFFKHPIEDKPEILKKIGLFMVLISKIETLVSEFFPKIYTINDHKKDGISFLQNATFERKLEFLKVFLLDKGLHLKLSALNQNRSFIAHGIYSFKNQFDDIITIENKKGKRTFKKDDIEADILIMRNLIIILEKELGIKDVELLKVSTPPKLKKALSYKEKTQRIKMLTKTDFISYKECEKNVWIKWHKPEEYKKFPVSEFEQALGVMGEDVEQEARKRFPGGILVPDRSEQSIEFTKELIAKHTPVVFQAVFTTDKYLAATDVIQWNEKVGAYDIYEIKMSSTSSVEGTENEIIDRKKETQYEYDIAFQTNVAKLCGVTFNKKYLVRLNNEYVRHGELDYKNLFKETDKTEVLSDVFLSAVSLEMNSAYEYLSQKGEPKGHCRCYFERGRSSHCTTFSLSNPDVPAYSVHDLNRIGNSKKLLGELLNEGILSVDDVPEDERLEPKKTKTGKLGKPKKLNQVRVYKTQKPIIDIESIKLELNSLKYPLYFLDYETYPTAIPPFNGYHPYQHIVFQYSLHILRSKDGALEHKECLILDGDPAERIVQSLRENIGDSGTIVSWYKAFENTRNRELANMLPEYAEFLHTVVDRTYDLMDIVDKQYYVHPGFKGSSSIKKIQPVIAPKFAYKELDVRNGTDAIEAYRQATSGRFSPTELEEKRQQMLIYCGYDTEVMYEIWKFFTDLVEESKE